jgi:small subunit ribosomal protein S20
LANHKSAEKRARSSLRRNAINAKTLSGVRTFEKKLRKSLAAKKKDESAADLKACASSIAKAAQKGRIHPRTASRKISRAAKQVSALA